MSKKACKIIAEAKNGVIPADQYSLNKYITNVTIPEGVKSIDERAFQNCRNLKKLTLPKSLKIIGDNAFAYCENLREVIIPEGVTTIGYCAFNKCTNLEKIVLPESLEKIEWGAFSGCKSLTEINIPKKIKKIEEKVFLGCGNLDVVIPETVTDFGPSAFQDCSSLTHFPENGESFGESCFDRCCSLTTATLHKNVTLLPRGMFYGCSALKEVICDHKIKIEDECFRECTSLRVFPEFIENFAPGAFDGCLNLKEITIINPQIGSCCFYGCENLEKINGSENIESIHNAAFKCCWSLKEIDLSNAVHIEHAAFEDCVSLKNVKLSKSLKIIEDRTFNGCEKLEEIELPEGLVIIGREAFRGCRRIQKLRIPEHVTNIQYAALANMESLKQFEIDPKNKIYESPDGLILLHKINSALVSYASGSRKKKYNLHKQVVRRENGKDVIYPITKILPYAFSSAYHLEELIINSCTSDLDYNTFEECPFLKKLTVIGVPMFSAVGFRFDFDINANKGEFDYKKNEYPFEEVEIKGHVYEIMSYGFHTFVNMKKLKLPAGKELYHIERDAFANCEQLKEVMIPNSCNRIYDGAFAKPTLVKFPFKCGCTHFNSMEYDNKSGKMYQIVRSNENKYFFLKRVLSKPNKRHVTDVWDIRSNIHTNSEYAEKNPDMYVDFLEELKKRNIDCPDLRDGYFVTMSIENKDILFEKFKDNKDSFLKLVKDSKILEQQGFEFSEYIFRRRNLDRLFKYLEIFNKYNITNLNMKSVVTIASIDPEEFEKMYLTDKNLLESLFDNSGIISTIESGIAGKNGIENQILKSDLFIDYFYLLHNYGVRDPFMQNKLFIASADNPLIEELLKHYDNNIKRLLKASNFVDIYNPDDALDKSDKTNFNDLLTYMSILGCFEDDPIIKQKASTFITEKSISKDPGNSQSEYKLSDNDFHRMFSGFSGPYKKGFAELFMENYQDMIHYEKYEKSGFIERVYKNYEAISESYTSNSGSQRKLKLTFDKCKLFLNTHKFDGVNRNNIELANFIGAWFDSNETWIKAQAVYEEAKKAPRNIFTPVTFDEDENPIYDYDCEKDLRGEVNNGLYYEWLPKQDYANLVLGKYCNCCAHLEGVGNGIMRASMVLDCCQNLVIRDEHGVIVAKSTLYINKDEQYGVFNNVEASYKIKEEKQRQAVYERFLEGAKALFETYNKYNPQKPLVKLTIGTTRNALNTYLVDKNDHNKCSLSEGIHFREYSYNQTGYDGDWSHSQRIVVRAKKEDQQ